MCNPSFYDHKVSEVRVVETHISWIILTGTYAYKVKKPVKLSFLDFSTLEHRKRLCYEELRLNRRLAEDLYLEVLPIYGSVENPALEGIENIIEYAVKMVQFDTTKELGQLIEDGLDAHLIDDLADQVADFHMHRAEICVDPEFSTAMRIKQRIMDNFTEIRPHLTATAAEQLNQIEAWAVEYIEDCWDLLNARKRDGFVRECHGDLHLGNMMLYGGRIRLFDCLEFNEQFRWIDVMSDIAFVIMDLDYRGHPDLGFQFLNRYLSVTGDFNGLKLLPLYMSYRSMVRAKVACIRAQQGQDGSMEEVENHLQLAENYDSPPPRLLITHGFSGSGKSWWSERLACRLPAIHIRSDLERKRTASVSAASRLERYSEQGIGDVYQHLLGLAETILCAGYTVLVDATFLRAHHRQSFYRLAEQLETEYGILDFSCSASVLRARIDKRLAAGSDPSEATIEVLETQLKNADPLDQNELHRTTTIQTEKVSGITEVISMIRT